uniref:Uncharacterized protein n=1 Tax=Trypanosoma congolense (strain IL3000) TaxID=1068625 RepID=G0UZY3_TRYCI|nr:hypothetical protein, unlikely [Trypanosoma congolense IL3000]
MTSGFIPGRRTHAPCRETESMSKQGPWPHKKQHQGVCYEGSGYFEIPPSMHRVTPATLPHLATRIGKNIRTREYRSLGSRLFRAEHLRAGHLTTKMCIRGCPTPR